MSNAGGPLLRISVYGLINVVYTYVDHKKSYCMATRAKRTSV